MVSYLLRMMTSWALVCNVWYLPAMHQQVCIACAKALGCLHIHSTTCITHRGQLILLFFLLFLKWQEGEDAVQFANRVKSAIAHQGGLVDLQW